MTNATQENPQEMNTIPVPASIDVSPPAGLPVRGGVLVGRTYQERKSGQTFKVSKVWNDSPTETAYMEAIVTNQGVYTDVENGVGTTFRWAFYWDDLDYLPPDLLP